MDLAGRKASPGHGPEGHGTDVFGAVRLPNGNTVIAGGNNNRVFEVDRASKVVWSIDQKELEGLTLAWVTTLHVLPNGNLIVGNCHAGPDNPQLFEVTREKKVVWRFNDFKTFGNSFAAAHVLDEYVQAAKIELARGGATVELRLIPGVEVAEHVFNMIDVDGDGQISTAEEQAYAQRVMQDVALEVDGRRAPLALKEFEFPSRPEMKGGVGAIRLRLAAEADLGAAGVGIWMAVNFDVVSSYPCRCRGSFVHLIAWAWLMQASGSSEDAG